MKSAWMVLGLAAAILAGCAPKTKPTPAPPPPAPVIVRPPPPPALTPAADWPDRELTTGAWAYTRTTLGSQAAYGPLASQAGFILRCEESGRQVTLERHGAGMAQRLGIRTTSAERSLPAAARIGPPPAYLSSTLAASDPLLDSIAFSRGRFAVEADGLPTLILPTWPEPARVIEDCRD